MQLEQGQAQLFRDQAQLRDAQLNYQRFKDLLHESGAMSQQQVDTQKAQADQLEGAVRADQAAIDNARLQITYSRITSPINGRIGLRLVDPGNIVHATDQNGLFVITQLHPIAVIFTLPEDSLPLGLSTNEARRLWMLTPTLATTRRSWRPENSKPSTTRSTSRPAPRS